MIPASSPTVLPVGVARGFVPVEGGRLGLLLPLAAAAGESESLSLGDSQFDLALGLGTGDFRVLGLETRGLRADSSPPDFVGRAPEAALSIGILIH